MDKTVTFSFLIGGALQAGFSSSLSAARSHVKRLGETVKDLRGDDAYRLGAAFETARAKVRSTGQELRLARGQLEELRKRAEASGGATGLLARQIEMAESRVKGLERGLRSQSRQLVDSRARMANTGQSATALTARYRDLSAQVARASAVQERFGKIQERQQANLNRRQELRGQILESVAMGAAAAAPVIQAASYEQAELRLGTVINAGDKDQALAAARASARAIGREGLVTSLQAMDIQYALNSAGLDAAAARAGALVVSRVAAVTSGVPEQVGEVVATAFNNLGRTMEGSTEEKIGRIGDLLTRVQFKYQIRDFGQLGESMKYASAGLAGYNVQLEQGVAVIGELNTAGLQGSMAGTALNAVLRNLSKAQAEWGTAIVRDKNGQLDLVATLGKIDAALSGLSQDDRAQAIQQVFGDEGARGLVPLLGRLKELPEAVRDVRDSSRGLVDAESARFVEASTQRYRAMGDTIRQSADSFGRIFLPAAAALFGGIGRGLGTVADFADRHQTLAAVLGGVIGGVLILGALVPTLGYAWTFAYGGALRFGAALLWVQNAQIGAAVAAKAAAAAQWLWNASLLGCPVILLGAALAGAAYLVYRNWEPIKAFFLDLWSSIGDAASAAWEGLKRLPLIGGALSFFTGGKAIPETVAKGIDAAADAPGAALDRSFARADEYIPHSDARRGPFSRLTEAGRAIPETMARGAASSDAWDGLVPAAGTSGRAARSGGQAMQITYAPQITLHGGGPDVRGQVDQALRESEARFREFMSRFERRERRLGYA